MTTTLPAPTLTDPEASVAPDEPLAPRATLGTILVTGGASGLGAATVAAVQAAGGTPLVLDRMAPADDDVPYQQVDLADSAAAEAAVAEHRGRQRRTPRRRVHRRRDRLVRTARRGLRRPTGSG